MQEWLHASCRSGQIGTGEGEMVIEQFAHGVGLNFLKYLRAHALNLTIEFLLFCCIWAMWKGIERSPIHL